MCPSPTDRPILRRWPVFASAVLTLALLGCGGGHSNHDHAHDHGAGGGHDHAHGHVHVAPHGGTLVVLADETFNLELVLDPATGTLDAYVLDGHAENFVRIAQPSFELVLRQADTPRTLTLHAVANPATGETVGDTAQFRATADWLRSPTAPLVGEVRGLTVRGMEFNGVVVTLPPGES